MEKLSRAFFSMRMMTVALIVFLLAIASATFIESVVDIQAAKIIVYNALWFEIVLGYLCLSLIANTFNYQMYKREKISVLTFHSSFIVIMIGAGMTRFIGFEGLMLIREGEKTNIIHTADPHVWFRINDGKMQYTYSEKQFLSPITSNDFSIDVDFPGHPKRISIDYVDFKKKMIDSLVVNDSIQGFVIELITEGMKSNYLSEGEHLIAGNLIVSFNEKVETGNLKLFRRGAAIWMKSDADVRYLPMTEMQKVRQSGGQIPDSLFVKILANTPAPFQTATLYQINGQQIVFKQILNHAKKMLLPSGRKNVGKDYLTLKITDGNSSKQVTLVGGMGAIPVRQQFNFQGLNYEMEYGSTPIEIPFYVACRDFVLDRYPGSNAPSSFASEVTILDNWNNYVRNKRIFMNHVMDYDGYRFFQSSYDADEKGTHLSVNHDWWGTNITYLGYLLMSIGMILSLFAPSGRFRDLNNKLKRIREKREHLKLNLMLMVMLSLSGFGFSQNSHDHTNSPKSGQPIHRIISSGHSEKLASLLVQDFNGRIIPLHTLCDQLLRKIYRNNHFKEYNAVQTILSMHMYPQYWVNQKIIQVPSVLQESMRVGSYCSYTQLADQQGQFKWMTRYNNAHRRTESKRDEYDKKIIKLVEKFQVVQEIFNWQYMKIIPIPNNSSNTWYVPLSTELMQQDSVSSKMVLKYIAGLDRAAETKNYREVDEILFQLKKYQRKIAGMIVPDERKVSIEISYNKMNVFKNTLYCYLTIGFLLLLSFFIRIFISSSRRKEHFFDRLGKLFKVVLFVIFIYHGIGLSLRWYISGHAPWSNGYEAVVFIAWATMIAGFIFSSKNLVILAGTAILASLMIFVTEMNLLDPEITPLQPVLKSYWLMIHVAVITSSYGFLGLGAILAIFNLTLYIFRNNKNGQLLTLHINELTYVSEMTITIGLFMLTIGTFLGGVWANESWGRYWGWDPKETWALVSVLVYAVILHLRFIPVLKGKFIFNVVALWGYSAIIFTFFGVNFYLTGLHSYAQGEGLGKVPTWVNLTIALFAFFTLFSYYRYKIYTKHLTQSIDNL